MVQQTSHAARTHAYASYCGCTQGASQPPLLAAAVAKAGCALRMGTPQDTAHLCDTQVSANPTECTAGPCGAEHVALSCGDPNATCSRPQPPPHALQGAPQDTSHLFLALERLVCWFRELQPGLFPKHLRANFASRVLTRQLRSEIAKARRDTSFEFVASCPSRLFDHQRSVNVLHSSTAQHGKQAQVCYRR